MKGNGVDELDSQHSLSESALSLSVFIIWLGTYSDDAHPKNICYVLWKHGLNGNMNLDSALAAMSLDSWPVREVQGLNKTQLQARFGFLRALDETTPYLRGCYLTPGAIGETETRGNKLLVHVQGHSAPMQASTAVCPTEGPAWGN